MILDFKFKNYKNFTNSVDLSFKMGQKAELKYHAINLNKEKYLPLKVIYGGNSVGKTNLLKAIATLKNIILRETIRKGPEDYIALCSSFNSIKNYESPMSFDITFSINKDIYNYKLTLKNNYENKTSEVLNEYLSINNKVIFLRDKQKISFSTDKSIIKDHYSFFENKDYLTDYLKMLEKNIGSCEVFTKWYSSIDKELCHKIMTYFHDNVNTIIDINDFKIKAPFSDKDQDDVSYSNSLVNLLLKELNVGNKELIFKKDNVNNFIPYSLYALDNKNIIADARLIESKGTLKLVDLIETIVNSLENGTTLFVDELDSSIHHEIITSLIEAYGDHSINKKGAQLIFTTHNPVYLNKNLLRRDEIVFVEKNDNNSSVATLEDYNLRNDEVYLKNYLEGSYTILPDFDIRNLMNKGNDSEKS